MGLANTGGQHEIKACLFAIGPYRGWMLDDVHLDYANHQAEWNASSSLEDLPA